MLRQNVQTVWWLKAKQKCTTYLVDDWDSRWQLDSMCYYEQWSVIQAKAVVNYNTIVL